MPSLTKDQLAELENSSHLHDRTAARIARLLDGQPAGTPVASNAALAVKLDVSHATASKAKRELARLGLLATTVARTYQIAAPA
jgi:DNA-binding transcriptional regulator YhcF (GntR family)